jgi:hypothetical protein
MYRVTKISTGNTVLSVWPAVYLNCPNAYAVTNENGNAVKSIDEII